jgi:hypothetical protein
MNSSSSSLPSAAPKEDSPKEEQAFTMIHLPSKRDRLLLYACVESVVEQKIRTLQSLPDTRPRDWRGRILRDAYPEPSTVATRGRQVYFLRMELLPIVAASLLLPVADLHQVSQVGNNSDSSNMEMDQFNYLQDPIASMTLLISNFVLLSKGNYDARIRHVMKAVCVQLFQDLYGGSEVPPESVIPPEYYSSAKALYTLTEEKNAAAKKEDVAAAKKKQKAQGNAPLVAVKEEKEDDSSASHNDDAKSNDDETVSSLVEQTIISSADADEPSLPEEADEDKTEDDVNNTDQPDSSEEAKNDENDDKAEDEANSVDWPSSSEKANSAENADNTGGDANADDQPNVSEEASTDDNSDEVNKSETTVTTVVEGADDDTDKAVAPEIAAASSTISDDDEEDDDEGQTNKHRKSTRRCIHLQASSLQIAKERFETLEKAIATDILQVMLEKEAKKQAEQMLEDAVALPVTTQVVVRAFNHRQFFLRSLQIGTVSLFVGGLFALTGGMAAPALVAAITAFGVGTAIPAFATLTTTAALASMFGVVGGGLAAYKMKKRTDGLSDWRIRKETSSEGGIVGKDGTKVSTTVRGLHATVCVSGWLQSRQDFQTPFGIQANDPTSDNDLDILNRFLSVHAPEKIRFTKALLKKYNVDSNIIAESISGLGLKNKDELKKSREEMYTRLSEKYGRDPRKLLPLCENTSTLSALNDDQNETGTPNPTLLLLDEATQTFIKGLLNSHILDKQHAKEMEEIFEANHMLGQMEMMNAEMFAQMTCETLETMKNTNDHSQPFTLEESDADLNVGDDVESHEDEDVPKIAEPDDIVSEEEKEPAEAPTSEHDITGVTSAEREVIENILEDPVDMPVVAFNDDTSITEELPEEATEANSDIPASIIDADAPIENKDPSQEDAVVQSTELDAGESATKEGVPDPQPSLVTTSSSESFGSDTSENKRDSLQEKGSSESQEQDSTPVTTTSGQIKMDHSMLVWDWQANYSGELYTVTWETEFLLQLCKVVEVFFIEVSGQVSKEVLKQTLIGGMVSAVAIPSALTTAIGVIDDPYQLISFRSEKAGVELAQCLLQSDEHRPVSLVGFSFGARVIFSCLLELARHQTIWEDQETQANDDALSNDVAPEVKLNRARRALSWMNHRVRGKRIAERVEYKREPASIVEDVVLIGLPMRIERKEWIACRELIAGRLVNCYNKNDWILSYMINIRCWNGVNKACGTHPILNIEGVENFEVSHLASSHGRYPLAVPHILHEVGYGEPWQRVAKVDDDTF